MRKIILIYYITCINITWINIKIFSVKKVKTVTGLDGAYRGCILLRLSTHRKKYIEHQGLHKKCVKYLHDIHITKLDNERKTIAIAHHSSAQ
jgi:hypothetical protein